MDWQALLLTLRLAALTTLILILCAVPLGYWLAYGRSRLKPLAEALVALPLVVPPTVLGFYLLVLLGPRTATGRALASLFGHPLAFSFAGLVVGSVLYSLPFAVQPIAAGFESVSTEVREAAILLSPRPSAILTRVLLPLIKPSLLTAVVLSFTHTVGEFGVVLMIGGSIPGITRTLSISIYDQVQNFEYGQANRTSLALLSISFLALLIIYLRRGMARSNAAAVSAGLSGDAQ
ncbi:MAG TPA: molybdate ABC transporter permease subunit [Acidobacteriaceae bacterium]|nr:molybdate ABC transporter permease subunit [Acidobacteriaceae bacterium]